MKIIDKEELKEYYSNHTQQQCAERFGVSRKTISDLVTKYGYNKTGESLSNVHKGYVPTTKEHIDKDVLYDLYINQNKTLAEVAESIGKSIYVVRYRLKEYGIKKDTEKRIENSTKAVSDSDYAKRIQKSRNTYFLRTGFENPFSNPEIKEKIKKTNNEKYGGNSCMSSEEIVNKAKNTCLSRYGTEHPAQNDDIMQKMKDTCMSRYGVDNHSKLDSFRNDMSNLNLKLYHDDSVSNFVSSIISSRETFREFIEQNNFTTTKGISDALDGYSICRIEFLLHRFDSWDLIPHHISYGEESVCSFLTSIGVKWEKTRTIIPPHEIDCYCPDYKIGIEFNGTYWHSSANVNRSYHISKSKECEKVGVRLIHIYEYEWNDPRTRPIIESILMNAFGKIRNRVYARKCEIREISNKEAIDFNNNNHLQGHRNASITYGLFYNNELVQLMSFSKNHSYEWEIIRCCTKLHTTVIGGESKLFLYFISNINPATVFSYCDFNKFSGNGYLNLGMKFIGYTGPDMKWIMGGQVYNRHPSQNTKFKNNSESQIFGSGSKKFLWSK